MWCTVRDTVNLAFRASNTGELDKDGKTADCIVSFHEPKRDTPKRRDNIDKSRIKIH